MLNSTTSRRRLGALAAACLLSVALPSAPAWAQKTKTKEAPAAETTAPLTPAEVIVDVPTIETVDSNVDEATLRAVLTGDLADNAEALAGLTATSITIPEITVSTSTTVGDETIETRITYSDLVLADVVDGVAGSVTVAATDFESGGDAEFSGDFGAFTAANFDIGRTLNMYGMVEGAASDEMATIYTDLNFEGGTATGPDVDCTIGAMTAAEFKARPLNYSYAEMTALAQAVGDDGDMPSPETMGKAVRMYADLFTAFESSPIEFEGFDCSGLDEQDRQMEFSVASVSIDGFSPGIYPAITMDGLDVNVEGDGLVTLGSATIKSMDLSGPLALIEAAPEALDEAWFTENARALFPAFEGFALSDLVIDVPDPENPETRIAASVGAFDLTLGRYINGIPADAATTASNIVFDLPTGSGDPQVDQLIALGVTSIDAGFTIDTSWNEADQTIAINEVSLTGADLATVTLAGTIANATEALFSFDENESLAAAMALAVANLKVDVEDAGLSDIILASVAAEQGSDAATMRPVFAGLAEGTVVGLLAGAAEAQKVGAAINSFVAGKATHLTIEMTANDEPGLGMADFMAAETDPTVLIGKVTIDATAE